MAPNHLNSCHGIFHLITFTKCYLGSKLNIEQFLNRILIHQSYSRGMFPLLIELYSTAYLNTISTYKTYSRSSGIFFFHMSCAVSKLTQEGWGGGQEADSRTSLVDFFLRQYLCGGRVFTCPHYPHRFASLRGL